MSLRLITSINSKDINRRCADNREEYKKVKYNLKKTLRFIAVNCVVKVFLKNY